MLVAERNGQIVGMAQWTLIHDMFWGMFGAEAGWLYVRPDCRGSGIVAALVARLCAQAAAVGAQFLHGGGGEGPSRLYERVAIGQVSGLPPFRQGFSGCSRSLTGCPHERLFAFCRREHWDCNQRNREAPHLRTLAPSDRMRRA